MKLASKIVVLLYFYLWQFTKWKADDGWIHDVDDGYWLLQNMEYRMDRGKYFIVYIECYATEC
jgi:hypothetical protein